VDNRFSGFELTETVKNKLEYSFIPLVLSQHAADNPKSFRGNIKVRIPKKSQVIILTSKTQAKHGDVIKLLQKRVVNMLSEDHAHIHNSIKFDYERQISLSRIELDFLKNESVINAENKKNESQLISAETTYKRLKNPNLVAVIRKGLEKKVGNERDNLNYLADLHQKLNEDLNNLQLAKNDMQGKIKEINTQLEQSLRKREYAVSGVSDPTQAMTMLMIDNKIQQSQSFLINLENRLHVQIVERLSNLTVEIRNNKRQQEAAKKSITHAEMKLGNFEIEQQLKSEPAHAELDSLKATIATMKIERERKIAKLKQKINAVQLHLDNLKPTRSVVPPMQSLRPRSIGRIKRLVLFAGAGLFLGLCVIFVLEFLEKVSQRRSAI
jgi:hypothetical protein